MSYDPIQRVIDIQLGGVFSERPQHPENLIIRAIDLKYHGTDRRAETVIAMSLQGYTQTDIGNLIGYSQVWIHKIIKSY